MGMLSEKLLLINGILSAELSLAEISTSESSFISGILSITPKISNKKLLERILRERLNRKEIDAIPNLDFMGVSLVEQVNSWLTVNLSLEPVNSKEHIYFEGQPKNIDDEPNKGLLFAHNILIKVLSGRLNRGQITTMPDLSFTGVVGSTTMESSFIAPFIGGGID